MYFIGTLTKFFVWWYSEGLVRLFKYQGAFLKYLMNFFSIGESLKHLLSPWKRLVGARRPGLEGFRDWLLDNVVSRGIGFIMRLFLLLLFLISLVLWLAAAMISTILWIGWPVIIPWTIIVGGLNV